MGEQTSPSAASEAASQHRAGLISVKRLVGNAALLDISAHGYCHMSPYILVISLMSQLSAVSKSSNILPGRAAIARLIFSHLISSWVARDSTGYGSALCLRQCSAHGGLPSPGVTLKGALSMSATDRHDALRADLALKTARVSNRRLPNVAPFTPNQPTIAV